VSFLFPFSFLLCFFPFQFLYYYGSLFPFSRVQMLAVISEVVSVRVSIYFAHAHVTSHTAIHYAWNARYAATRLMCVSLVAQGPTNITSTVCLVVAPSDCTTCLHQLYTLCSSLIGKSDIRIRVLYLYYNIKVNCDVIYVFILALRY
jgi:hypothetical protein